MNIGYACINLSQPHLKTNRSMKKATFQAKGLSYTSELALKNVTDLYEIFKWNVDNKILLFRITSNLFPWMSEYEISDLPDYLLIKKILNKAGKFAKENNLRLTFHPGPFNVLPSLNQNVVNNTIKELEQHSEIGDMLLFQNNHYNKINIHIGGTYGNKQDSIKRFILNYNKLSSTLKSRITLENDWKPNCFNIVDLYEVYQQTGIPIVYDFHHHLFNHQVSVQKALELSSNTWNKIKPIVHYSESIFNHSHREKHSEYIEAESINLYDYDVDVMFEAKAKDLAVIKFKMKVSYE